MDHSQIEDYLGVPVIVQLRFPIAGIMTEDKGKLPYARDPDSSQWVPVAHMDNGSPSGTQLVQCAVLYRLEGASSPSLVEMRWSSIPAPPKAGSGAIIGPVATLATLLDAKDIVAITRVVSVLESSPLILMNP